jgi:AbrB family looped-hinge helix DNA binding protein
LEKKMEIAKIGRRGQLTLPRKVRGALKVKEGDRLFFISRGEEMVIKPLRQTLRDLRGTVPVKGEQDFDEIREKVRMAVSRKAAGDES